MPRSAAVAALAAVLLALALLAPAGARALDAASVSRALSSRMPGGAGALAVDAASGRVLFARQSAVPRVPASNQKLLTTTVALRRFGPQTTIATELRSVAPVRRGVLRGTLYLRGLGDPTLSEADLDALAASVVRETRLRRIAGPVAGDDTYFDRVRGTPYSAGRYNFESGFLGSLVVGRGFQQAPATRSALLLHRALRRRGVRIDGGAVARQAPAGAQRRAAVRSAPMGVLARLVNTPSDNFVAEMLLKGLGARYGDGGSTAAGAAVVRRDLARVGVATRAADGSGLTTLNRIAPREVVDLLRYLRENPRIGVPLRASLPIAGRTGTLQARMRGTAAQGRCQAKTGTLRAVSSISGFCTTTAGREVLFSILMTGTSTFSLRARQDGMVAALARYSGG